MACNLRAKAWTASLRLANSCRAGSPSPVLGADDGSSLISGSLNLLGDRGGRGGVDPNGGG